MRYLGAHVSTAGGWDKAVKKVSEMGGNTVQIFTSSPRMWKATEPDKIDFKKFLAARKEFGVKRALIHATYLINLASDKPDLVIKSREALTNDMEICARGEFDGVVVHLGSHQGRGYESVREQMISEIGKIVKASPSGAVFLIENSAGQKGKIASELTEVKELIEGVGSGQVGWCFDTCHGHASGKKLTDVASEIGKLKLWKSLKCVHVNDSRDTFGSGRDRHENIGDGELDKDDLKEFLNNRKLKSVPLVLEVPGIDGKGPDKENLDRLKKLVGRG